MAKIYAPSLLSERAKKAALVVTSQRSLLLSGFGTVAILRQKKHVRDFVTEIDIAVEKSLKKQLSKDPEIDFYGEELGYNPKSKKYWLCDPIDGTNCYVRGLPFATCALAYVEDNEVLIGIIYDFVNDELYIAEKGKGAYCNGNAISVSNRPLDEAFYALTYNPKRDPSIDALKYLNYLRSHSWPLDVVASCYKLAMIASGKLDIYTSPSGSGAAWDRAAGLLLVREAGGVYKDFQGNDANLHETKYIATNETIYNHITESSDSPFFIG